MFLIIGFYSYASITINVCHLTQIERDMPNYAFSIFKNCKLNMLKLQVSCSSKSCIFWSVMLEIFGGTACEFTDFLVAYLNVIVFRNLRSMYFIGVLEFDIFLCAA